MHEKKNNSEKKMFDYAYTCSTWRFTEVIHTKTLVVKDSQCSRLHTNN